jgi:hypothetical protein
VYLSILSGHAVSMGHIIVDVISYAPHPQLRG